MSTYNLVMTTRPGGILALAQESQEFRQHLEPFSGTEPLDLAYASLHTQWLHWSDIPLRSARIVRDAQGVQTFYIDDVPGGTWEFQPPCWLGLEREPGKTRWYEAAPGTSAWVHRSDNGHEPWWQVVLVPLLHDYTGDMRPVRD